MLLTCAVIKNVSQSGNQRYTDKYGLQQIS